MLAYAGYVPGNEIQSTDTIKAIYITLAVLPTTAYLLSLPLLAAYDLTEEKLRLAQEIPR